MPLLNKKFFDGELTYSYSPDGRYGKPFYGVGIEFKDGPQFAHSLHLPYDPKNPIPCDDFKNLAEQIFNAFKNMNESLENMTEEDLEAMKAAENKCLN